MNAPARARHAAATFLLFTPLVLAPVFSLAAPAIVVRPTTLFERPLPEARKLETLAARQRLEIIAAQGSWNQVKVSDGTVGWVRLLDLRPEPARGARSPTSATQPGGSAGTSPASPAEAAGDRTIRKGEPGAAEPNLAEVERLENFHVSAGEARQYAAMSRLKAREVPPLPEGK